MPKVVDHDERRASVVAATRAVVAAEGIEAATMRRIADAAGCTTGRITHYFADKDEVLVAVLRSVHLAAAERMARRLTTAAPDDRLRAVIEEALPLDGARLEEWRVWIAFWGRAAGVPELEAEQRARYDEWSGLVAGLLVLDRDHRHVDRLLAAVDGIGLRATLYPDTFTPDRQLAAIESLFPPRA